MIHLKLNINTEKLAGFNQDSMPLLHDHTDVRSENHHLLTKFNGLLSQTECDELIEFFQSKKQVTVNNYAIKLKHGSSQSGIKRSCFYDGFFAEKLYQRIKHLISNTMEKEGDTYQLLGLNPLIRFISYQNENQKLIPHYDTPIQINEKIITFKTIIIYLTSSNSGCTNFLEDTRHNHNYQDADSNVSFPVIFSQKPESGNAICFDHFIFHESSPILNSESKTIITTEICYQKIN